MNGLLKLKLPEWLVLACGLSCFLFLSQMYYLKLATPSQEDINHEHTALQTFSLKEMTTVNSDSLKEFQSAKPQLGILLYLISGLSWVAGGAEGGLLFRFLLFGTGIFIFFKFIGVYAKDPVDRLFMILLYSSSLWWVTKFVFAVDWSINLLLSFIVLLLLRNSGERKNLFKTGIAAFLLFNFKISAVVFLSALFILLPFRINKRQLAVVIIALGINVLIFLGFGGFSRLEERALISPLEVIGINLNGIAGLLIAPWKIFASDDDGNLAILDYFRFLVLLVPLFLAARNQKREALKLSFRLVLSALFTSICIILLSRKDHASYGMQAYSIGLETIFYLAIFLAFTLITSSKVKYFVAFLFFLLKGYEAFHFSSTLDAYQFRNNQWTFYQKVRELMVDSKAQNLLTFCMTDTKIAEFYLGSKITYVHYNPEKQSAKSPAPALVDHQHVPKSLALIPMNCQIHQERRKDIFPVDGEKWITTIAEKEFLSKITLNKFETYDVYYLR